MAKMHENELELTEMLVHTLLKNQCPQWANLPIKAVISSGTDNALYRLGHEYIVRLPRVEWTPGSNQTNITKEYEWIPKIAPLLKTPISAPIFKGQSDKSYPWIWTITRWNEGQNPEFEIETEHHQLAKDLAEFLNELHGVSLSNGPLSRRGTSLNEPSLDVETRKAICELEGELDTQALMALWEKLSNTPAWTKAPLWVHGDFLPGNILVKDNRLSAVIDFSDVGMGDPACDLVIAWSLLGPYSRKIFKGHLADVDEDTWQRGRGRALSIALIMLPYYKNSNPYLAALARRMIANVLREGG